MLSGGRVAKFSGDAVRAVWGTPVATEDDAERAVRAALDLVAAVSALGDEVGAPELRARAGVLTGDATVTDGGRGGGMAGGDLGHTEARGEVDAGFVLVARITKLSLEVLSLTTGTEVIATFKASAVHLIRRSPM